MSAWVELGLVLVVVGYVALRMARYRDSIRPDTPQEAAEAAYWNFLNGRTEVRPPDQSLLTPGGGGD